MSDYTQVNDYSAKDDLPPNTGGEKIIMGADWDEDFAAISTAIATKYDSADLASQAEAEAGAASTLLTPLRTLQFGNAMGLRPLSQLQNNWNIHRLGVSTVTQTTYTTFFDADAVAAGWNDFEIIIPYLRGGTGTILSIMMSLAVAPLYFFAAIDDPNSSGGFASLVTVGDLSNPELSISTTVASDTIRVRGTFYVASATTMSILLKHTVSGGTGQPTIDSNTQFLRRSF